MLKLNIFHSFSARNTIVSNSLKPSHVNVAIKKSKTIANVPPFMLTRASNLGNNIRITTSLTQQIRFAHTDIKVPDWTEYRRKSVKSPKACTNDSEDYRKIGSYLLPLIGLTGSYYGTKCHSAHYILFMDASADVLATAKSEVNINEIPEGVSSTIKWRGKPVFITHRTQESIKREREVDVASLRDPEKDDDRVQRPEWLVVIGVCTHLGCIPIANMGDFHGYYCPCHGSHFDGSGRIRKGPAPTNLEIPHYTFTNDKTIVIG